MELHSWHDDVLKATVVHHVNAADWKRMMTHGGGNDDDTDAGLRFGRHFAAKPAVYECLFLCNSFAACPYAFYYHICSINWEITRNN